MARRYSQHEKQRTLDAVAAGAKLSEVAAGHGISVSTLRRWVKAAEQGGSGPPSPPVSVDQPNPATPGLDTIQLVAIDSGGDTGKILRILRNEGLPVVSTRLADHSHARFVPDHLVWRNRACVIDLQESSARRVFELLQRSGRDLPLVLVGGCARIQHLANPSHAIYLSAVEEGAMELLGAALEREYQLATLRAGASRQQAQVRQLMQCSQRGFDHAANPVAIIGDSGHYYANSAYLELFGGGTLAQIREVQFNTLVEERVRSGLGQTLDALQTPCASASIKLQLQCGARATVDATLLPGSARQIQLVFQSLQTADTVLPEQSAGHDPALQTGSNATLPTGADDADVALWAGRIASALKDDSLFSVVYQPIVGLCGASSGCYEALLRMHDGDGSEILPGRFIPAAEKAGLMDQVDQWVISHAVKLIAEQQGADAGLTIFVNLSPSSLFNGAFPGWLGAAVDVAGIQGKQLTLEISRDDLLHDIRAARIAIRAIRAIGCAVVIDDFDSESVKANLLQQVEADYVKIDRTLVLDVNHSEDHLNTIKAIIQAAQQAGVRTIAGCVQEAESVSLLWRCGVDYVQGYFLQHPSQALDYDFGSEEEEPVSTGWVVV